MQEGAFFLDDAVCIVEDSGWRIQHREAGLPLDAAGQLVPTFALVSMCCSFGPGRTAGRPETSKHPPQDLAWFWCGKVFYLTLVC